MKDLIDRQAAIDALDKHCDVICQYSKKQRSVMCGACSLGTAFDVIENLPSAQPYSEADIQKMQDLEQAEIQKAYELGKLEAEQRWIPCKIALPEKGQYVLCQCRAGIMDVLHLTDDNGWYKDSTHIYMHGFVLAWMPLPEPYREEGTE